MTENNDINSTNGAPKEYWEARAQNEREQAKAIASARRIRTIILLITGCIFLFFIIFLISLFSGCASTGTYGTPGASSSTEASAGRIISEGFTTSEIFGTYWEVTFYLPGTGNVSYVVYENRDREAEDEVRIIRAEVNSGGAASEDITDWINPVVKKYMRERNVRVMTDYPSIFFIHAIIRSTNPESFERVTLYAEDIGPPPSIP
jgi:hypothetical protein